MKRFLTALVFLMIFSLAALVQTAPAQTQKGGVIFKVPDKVFPMDWNKNGFKGMLMLRQDSPSGIFIGYPNDGETIEDLRERAAKFIAPMVISDEAEKKGITFQKNSIPNHKGDAGDSALYYLYANDDSMVQILFYERVANGKSLIYGYFASRGKTTKPESVKDRWADDKGQGVKIFEKFWKTLKE
jgi:hypothetical protein